MQPLPSQLAELSRVLALPLIPEAWGGVGGQLMLCRRMLEDTAFGCLDVSFGMLQLTAQCLGYGGLATAGLLLGLAMTNFLEVYLFFCYAL